MGVDILNIAKTGIYAAQAGINTTGNNISNANTPGYTRQQVIQSSHRSVQDGPMFFGNGARLNEIKRVFNDFVNNQMVQAQSTSSQLETYLTQISQIDNMLSDPESGLTPAIQDFFKGVQNLSSNPTQARQAMLSSAEALAGRFRGMEARLMEISDGVNSEIETNVLAINAHAAQIAKLNETIAALSSGTGQAPNDLLDKRDQVINELSKVIRVNVSKEGSAYSVTIGTGQPLVAGNRFFELSAKPSLTDNTQLAVNYSFGGTDVPLNESLFAGGALGGLFEFRSEILNQTRNSLGRIGIALAQSFNDQHRLGQDSNGAMGTNFFVEPQPRILPSRANSAGNTLVVGATVADATALTTSDYEVMFDGTDYSVRRLSDGNTTLISPYPQGGTPQRIDGIDFSLSDPAVALRGDSFLVQPTTNGAAMLQVAITDINKIAAAAPVTTAAAPTNIGTAQISVGSVDADFVFGSVTPPVVMTFDKPSQTFSFEQLTVPPSPLTGPISVTRDGVDEPGSPYAPGAPITFAAGATVTFGGVSFVLSGTPEQGDSFRIGPNIAGVGDNRNAQLLAGLQTKNIVNGGHLTFQSAYASVVGLVGNKTGELQVTSQSADALLRQTTQANQSISGVNLDEEAANLLKYQQAYQAAGKVMQIASQLFDTLINLR